MRASLRYRALARILLLAALVVGAVAASAGTAAASGPTSLGVSGWQVYSNTNLYGNPDGVQKHGDIGEYAAAPAIPAQDDAGWADCGPSAPTRYSPYNGTHSLCPNATTIGMAVGSIIPNHICWSYLNFTYFQALVSIPAGTNISTFTVNMSGADDGARISLVNSAHPDGVTPAAGYIGEVQGQSTGDLSGDVVAGEVNRVIITQVDDCATGNNLSSAQIELNGNVIPPAPTDTTAPTDSPVYPTGWVNHDTSVDWNWTDTGGSGIDPANCTQTSPSSGEGAITLTASCSDLAGNTNSDTATVYVDKTAPTDAPTYPSGWSNSDVTVDWNWTDTGGSGIDSANCTQSNTSTGEGSVTVSSTCYDIAGNSSSDSVTVLVDKTAPTVTYTGGGTYTVDQNVTITCTPNDAVSGVASNTCSNISAPAWSLGLGTHPLSASATDFAGNTGSGSTSYTVKVDATSLCNLATQWAKNAGLANSLCVKLQAAAAAGARGQQKTKQNNIDAFDNEVSAQSGKGFTAAQARLLVQFAAAL